MKLIDNWKAAHRWASIRLAAVAGIVVAYFAAHPDQWQAVLSQVPEAWRPFVGLIAFAIAGGSRVVTFRKPEANEPDLN